MIAHGGVVAHLTFAVVAVAATAAYGWAWRTARNVGLTQLVAWGLATVAVVVATSPPIERLAAATFTGHMVQHLGLIVLAAPLFAVARPVSVFANRRPGWVVPTSGERRSARSVRRWGPAAAPAMFLVVLFATHLTGIYDLALRSRSVHDLEHAAYLGSAVALWAVVLAPNSAHAAARVGTAFAVIAGSAALGAVLTSADRPLIATYATLLGDTDALRDQRLAASLMWVGGMASSLPLLMAAVWTWASREQRTAERAEQLSDARR
ncbi:MAG: cytochrome c oxidase assembly protein [Ilumatobacteraceae bacterium]